MPNTSIVNLTNVIQYWQDTLQWNSYLMEPSVRVLVQATINHLKELKRLENDK